MSEEVETGDFDVYLEKLREFFEDEIPFNAHLGMRIEELSRDFARLVVPFKPEYVGDSLRPALHGGVISTLLDTAGGIAAFTTVRPGDRLSTVDLRVDYLRPAKLHDVIAEARVIRSGNRVAVSDIVAYQDDPSAYIATGKGVYNIARQRS